MSRTRRFKVPSLEFGQPGDVIQLPADEARHVRVLRLKDGSALELFDAAGRRADAELVEGTQARIAAVYNPQIASGVELVLATAWPKGKRAAVLVEKCAELGVSRIISVKFSRSVVSKDEESEGLQRLRRIAAEAAKQSGRNDVPEIEAEVSFKDLVTGLPAGGLALVLDPKAGMTLAQVLLAQKQYLQSHPLLLLVGPEGGLTADEITVCGDRGVAGVRLASHVLRVETAAIAACATVAGVLL